MHKYKVGYRLNDSKSVSNRIVPAESASQAREQVKALHPSHTVHIQYCVKM
jgi:hypothetical protein